MSLEKGFDWYSNLVIQMDYKSLSTLSWFAEILELGKVLIIWVAYA